MLSQPVVAHGAVVAFHISVLLRLARLNVVEAYSVLPGPSLQTMADILRAVVAPDGLRLAAPLHNLLQDPDDAL